MSQVLKLSEQLCKLERLIRSTRNSDLKKIMRDEYERLGNELKSAVRLQDQIGPGGTK